jgi:hypothetical protein
MAKKGAKRPAIAAKVANDALGRCLAKGGNTKQCEASAIRIGLHAANLAKEKHHGK